MEKGEVSVPTQQLQSLSQASAACFGLNKSIIGPFYRTKVGAI